MVTFCFLCSELDLGLIMYSYVLNEAVLLRIVSRMLLLCIPNVFQSFRALCA